MTCPHEWNQSLSSGLPCQGIALYSAVPAVGRAGQIALFCGIFCLIMTMYGGGFAAIPAYLADLFGTGFVGAIHGRLLTAWSVAGILGPVLVNYVNGTCQ